MAKLIVRRNLFKGKPFKAAAYWYSVVKFPTFRRKAYGFKKQSEDHALKPVISIKYFSKFFYSQKWVFLPILTHLCGYWNICLQVPQYSDKILQNKRRPKIFHFFERLPFILNSFVCHDQIHSAAKTNIPDTGILSFLHGLNLKVMRIFITYSISLTISCTAPPSSTFSHAVRE